jgi:hypothetical protein
MSELLEQGIRDIYMEDAASCDTTDAVQRLRAVDYRRRTERHRKRLAAVGASGAGLTAGIIATVILLLSSGAPAYAGWSPQPMTASAPAVAASAAACRRTDSMGSAVWYGEDVFTGQPVLTESRGIYTAAIYVTDGNVYACLTGTEREAFSSAYSITGQLYGTVAGDPGPDRLGVPYPVQQYMFQGRHPGQLPLSQLSLDRRRNVRNRDRGGGYGRSILGQAGTGVTAVTFSFDGGNTVSATVENGWYFAWWPWLAEPSSVELTTGSQTVTSPIVGGRPPFAGQPTPGCQPGAPGCVFVTTR